MRIGPQEAPGAHRSGSRTEGVPALGLRGRVRGYSGFSREPAGKAVWRETPAAEVVLVLDFADGYHARATPTAGALSAYTSFVAGLHDRPTVISSEGRQTGIQVRLDPLAAFSLFGVPLHSVGNRIVELSDLLGPDANRWAERLGHVRTWTDRFTLLDQLITDRLAAGPLPDPQTVWAWRALRCSAGTIRVAELARRTGRSHRHLVAAFRDQVGLTPKTAGRVLRYERAAQLLADGNTTLAQLAARCGFADQAHLTREFSRFSGTTPGAARGR